MHKTGRRAKMIDLLVLPHPLSEPPMKTYQSINQREPLFTQPESRRKKLWVVVGCVVGLTVLAVTLGVVYGRPKHDSGSSAIDGKDGFLSLSINQSLSNGSMWGALATVTQKNLGIQTEQGSIASAYLHATLNGTLRSGDDACYAGPGTWGPRCSSHTGLSSPFQNYWIYYHIEAIGDTAVFCEVAGAACPSGGPCCWNWHPRTAGTPIWNGPIAMIWGNNAATPAIVCMGSPTGSSLRWSWSAGQGPLGCYNGYNCNIPGC